MPSKLNVESEMSRVNLADLSWGVQLTLLKPFPVATIEIENASSSRDDMLIGAALIEESGLIVACEFEFWKMFNALDFF